MLFYSVYATEGNKNKRNHELFQKVLREARNTMDPEDLAAELKYLFIPDDYERKQYGLNLVLDRTLSVSEGKTRYINGKDQYDLNYDFIKYVSQEIDSFISDGEAINGEQYNKMKIIVLRYVKKIVYDTNYGSVSYDYLCWQGGNYQYGYELIGYVSDLVDEYLKENEENKLVKEILIRCSNHVKPFKEDKIVMWEKHQRDITEDLAKLNSLIRKIKLKK